MSINSSSFQSNALTVDGSTAITSATSNLNNNLTSSINNVSNNITSLYLSSQNYIIPSSQVNNYTVNNVYTINANEFRGLINVPSNGITWSSDGQASVLLTCSENNIDLTPLIQNNINLNDSGILALLDYAALYDTATGLILQTYQYAFMDSPHFTYCSFGTATKYRLYKNTIITAATLAPAINSGVYNVWFQYAFNTPFIATSVIISVGDYTQSPDLIFY
jgi:hypothetical protein